MPLTRRQFLRGIGVGIGGLTITGQSYEHLVPFIQQPDDMAPGVSSWYATSCRECPAGCGMVLRNRESRVVKCEGNPQHPINRGTLCSRGQAALHGLYDPDRIKNPLRRDGSGALKDANWDDALDAVAAALKQGGRLAVISDLQTGSLDTMMRAWVTALGSDRMLIYEPINYESVKAASGGVVPKFNIAGCDYLISFAADFLETWISPVEYAREFTAMRQVRNGIRARFVYVGPRVSMTAANADVRLIVPPGAEVEIASAIMTGATDNVAHKYNLDPRDISRIASEFASAAVPLALPGGDAGTARAAMTLNTTKGADLIDRTKPHAVTHIASRAEVDSLVRDMEHGGIDTLLIFGANPIYSMPKSARFADALKRVKTVISLSSFIDETTARAHWVLPSNTPLESWGDYLPYPDVANLMQPTMGTLFDTRQTGDILIELARRAGLDPTTVFKADTYYEYLRARWGAPLPPESDPDTSSPHWESLMQVGGRWPGASGNATPPTGYETASESGSVPVTLTPAPAPVTAAPSAAGPFAIAPVSAPKPGDVRLWAYPHIYMYDGRGANRRWLQEMPEPVTNCLWGTWAEMHPSTASKLGVDTDDLVEIDYQGAKVTLPAYVWDGVARDTIAVPIGEGHTEYGRYASGTGVNVLPLLGVENPMVKVAASGGSKWITRIKGSADQHGREIVQTAILGEPVERDKITMPLPSGYGRNDIYPPHDHPLHRWAMVVDMDKCIGCHACVTACYAESNLAVVGPEGIYRRREMPWIRIDRYIDWRLSSAPILFQPMLCQHCDAAPCEPVCPVFAAAHSDEGINMQAYNRCVGTRYCSHNCPYKVRRFNWFDYDWPEPMNYQLNPDVTVRSRGVMEKCTFCIQRIRQAEIVAKRDNRPVQDGEITPACAGTCPTGVFTFGDLKDPNSRVSKLIDTDPRAYQALRELNTKPAVIYLKTIVEKV
ncbi:MAG: 4Fe-4S dicluster domain-containing protein [Armatimonadetes bacterium]|nr:4Fe-4S dicluster domain-containing protein [Armatimonadota bacterium]